MERPVDDSTGVTYSNVLEDAITAYNMGIPIHIWNSYPRSSRAFATATRKAIDLLDWVAMPKEGQSNA